MDKFKNWHRVFWVWITKKMGILALITFLLFFALEGGWTEKIFEREQDTRGTWMENLPNKPPRLSFSEEGTISDIGEAVTGFFENLLGPDPRVRKITFFWYGLYALGLLLLWAIMTMIINRPISKYGWMVRYGIGLSALYAIVNNFFGPLL